LDRGEKLGDLPVRPAVDERISGIARRIAALVPKIANAHPGLMGREPRALPLQRFRQADLMQWWNPEWRLERAGFGGGGGGMAGLRGATLLEGETLVTWPEDEARGLVLRRTLTPRAGDVISVQVRADPGKYWWLDVYAGNQRLLSKLVDQNWQTMTSQPLDAYAGQATELRLYQRINLTGNYVAGSAHWRRLRVATRE